MLREMPPWPPDPNQSLKFRNDARLTGQDIKTLVDWVNAGAPQGDSSSAPAAPQFADGWIHPDGRKPDLVISLPGESQVPATGVIPYIRYLVKVPLTEDKWIEACQTRPENPAIVHHMAITEVEMDERFTPADLDAMSSLTRRMGLPFGINPVRPAVTSPSNRYIFDMLAIYTPGSTIEIFGNDSAKLLKGGKNRYVNFNIHYQATGKPEKDRSQIAFWFRTSPPKHQLYMVPGAADTIIVNGKELLTDIPGTKAEGTGVAIPPIPPGADNYELVGVTGYTRAVTIYQFHPHAHLRGKDFKYVVFYPDGREETVLTIPKYDFRWQLAYELETPLTLPAGSKLVITAHYDNSANNKFNPAPDKEVYFRDQNQSWDEMFSPFVQYTFDGEDLSIAPPAAPLKPGNGGLPVVQVVGCLTQESGADWMLTLAGDPVASPTQATNSIAVKAAVGSPFGNQRFRLVGAGVFHPSQHKGERMAVKGVLIKASENAGVESRLNVTSLQPVSGACAN
jgi:hypothetical protein